ncbi:DUF5011 domain-containing protein, partial [Patescibacteria group bacterium]|nr:DUF5011 domain-containing protein [Patescibacteria group bacterium]MBU4116042.1 DUF5011 domain-containing protein [Patescibacteria group bacterium]
MENRKFVILIIIFLINFVFSNEVYSYGTETHRAITKEAIEFYNEFNTREISQKEKEIIMLGSKEEDRPIYRTVNHFYDPIYDRGLSGIFLPAYNWAENTNAQAMYSPQYALLSKLLSLYSSNSDYSFDRAVYEYVWGNKERGLETLGHILHLIEDMSVPAHTRDDQHINGDYYETYARKYDVNTINDISEELIKNKERQKQFPSLFDFFFSIANYSNNNFFSGNTISNNKYVEPKIEFEKKDLDSGITFGYKNLDKKNYKLIGIETLFSAFTNKTTNTYFIDDDNNLILSDHWSLLSKQAVIHASGVISLFFEKVKEEEDTMALFNKNRDSIKKLFGSSLYQTASVQNADPRGLDPDTTELGSGYGASADQRGNDTSNRRQNQNNQQEDNKTIEQEIKKTINQENVVQGQENQSQNQNQIIKEDQNTKQEEQENNLIPPSAFQIQPGFGGGGGGGGSTPSVQNTRPVITLTGNASITITKGDAYTDAGATAADLEDGNITSNIVTTGLPINTSASGTYTIRYNVTDS